ncbi:MAG: restriction endonuclease [Gammaproteobacteria bacterium]|nr:restriction endonuclease [Gammaproteobacteria bacterium]MBU1479677.1 restriction endonuclease [Gammaproteobacteria bacterium]MBU1999735.1 restriction endonuclease [Gammaproteobacteria bacterium]MBU2131729.1 restriction endonuclease [Gammaproteobacteria bacterium]MBU2187895.1 restriction endonuclease [Gammaproteobacteria bacterium]
MAKKDGKQFELLVKAIYEEILEQDSVESISVKHDVSLKGRSGQEHQIDVYWSFKLAGETIQVAIECKDYNSAVSVGRIRDFSAALDDIGNVKGIFVTTKGYQTGAIKFAEFQRIALKTVQEPTDSELNSESEIESIVVNGNILYIDNVRVSPKFDLKWVLENTEFKEGDSFSFDGKNDEIKVLDSNFNLIGTILDFENKLPRSTEDSQNLQHKFEFEDGYFYVPNSNAKPWKIEYIDFTYDTHTYKTQNHINLKLTAKAVLKDVVTGEVFLFKKKVDSTCIYKTL